MPRGRRIRIPILASAVTLALALPALTGCLAALSPPEPGDVTPLAEFLSLTDPEGDAVENGPGALGTIPYKCRAAGGQAWGACAAALAPAGAAPRDGGTPAPAALDAVSVRFSETADTLSVHIGVASLDPDLAGAVPADGSRGAQWAVCWSAADVVECASLSASRVAGGLAVGGILFQSGPCNDWGFCWWRVPHAIEYGAPATIRLDVPRAALTSGGAGGILDGPVVLVQTETPARALPGTAGDASWQTCGPVQEFGRHDANHNEYPTDGSAPGEAFTFSTAAADARMNAPVALVVADVEADAAGVSGDIDIVEVHMIETPAELMVSMLVADVADPPGDHLHLVSLGTSAGPVVELGYEARDGRVTPFTGCGEPPAFGITRVTGTPGWLNVTIPRELLGSPGEGDVINLFLAQLWKTDGSVARDVGPSTARAAAGARGDVVLAPPYWFSNPAKL